MDLPVPTHLERTFNNFKEKYEIVKQREIKRKILLSEAAVESAMQPMLESKAHPAEQTAKTVENLTKGLKGRKSLQMPMKRSSSK